MWAVYYNGPTDSFLQAMFMTEAQALQYVAQRSYPEDFHITYWETIQDIDTSDTGWEQ